MERHFWQDKNSLKIRKIQNGRPFGRDKNVWKNVLINLQRYPVGQKFC